MRHSLRTANAPRVMADSRYERELKAKMDECVKGMLSIPTDTETLPKFLGLRARYGAFLEAATLFQSCIKLDDETDAA